MLPAVVCLEIARAAAARRADSAVSELSQIVWPQPLSPNGGCDELKTFLTDESGTLTFAMTSRGGDGADAAATVHCQGRVTTGPVEPAAAPEIRDIASIRAR